MYFIPQKYKCRECGFEIEYNQSSNYTFLAVNNGVPLCYKCMIEFLAANIPTMELVGDECDHNWVDASNEHVVGGLVCTKCKDIKPS